MLQFLAFGVLALSSPQLQIDPLLIVEAEEIWSVIGKKGNAVWPGWDARSTPILIYFPNRQDVLINHPKPPEGFVKYTGLPQSKIGPIYVRDGKTVTAFDGQNTSMDINGVRTLVIADSLSTRRQWVQGLASSVAADPDGGGKLIESSLFPNPYSQITMFAHEAFHVYQETIARHKLAPEDALMNYPTLSVENNVGYALEAEFLTQALNAKSKEDVRQAAVKWMAVREDRRKALTPKCAAYEDGTEFSEGTAKYVEYRLLQALEGKKPSPEMWLIQGFKGFADLSGQRAGLIRSMEGFMSGRNLVNNDAYGASGVRFRLYYSGMAAGALLDRLGMEWHDRILKTNASLTSLAQEAIHASPQELSAALAEVKQSGSWKTQTEIKQKLAEEGAQHIREQVEKFATAPGELVLDYSGLANPQVGFSFTPFGILRVDDDRNIFRLIPIRGQIGGFSFGESGPRPVLHDRMAKAIHLQLTGAPEVSSGSLSGTDLNLPGVDLKNVKGEAKVEGRKVTIHLRD